LLACAQSTESGGFEELPYDASTGAGTTSSTTSQGGTGGTVPQGGEGGTGATGGTGGTGGTCDFSAQNTCQTAQTLSQICGDEGNDLAMVSGIGSGFFQIYVAECANSDTPLSFEATLLSPIGMDYDFYMSVGDDSAPDCGATWTKSGGNPDSLSAEWGDNWGFEDGTWFSIEVRHASGNDCTVEWTLTVQGHTSY
jgi:hypothetical protein